MKLLFNLFVFFVFFSSQSLAEDLFLKCKINEKREQTSETFSDLYNDLDIEKFELEVNLYSKHKKEFLITVGSVESYGKYILKFNEFIGTEMEQTGLLSNKKDLLYVGVRANFFLLELSYNRKSIKDARIINSSDKNYSKIKKSKKSYREMIIINRNTGEIKIDQDYVHLTDNLIADDPNRDYPYVRYVGTCKANKQKTLF